MDLRPYVCKQCNGTINPVTIRCEYCGTYHSDDALKQLVITTRTPGQHTIRAEVRIGREFMQDAPGAARDYTLRQLREQIADGLLGFMKITTSHDMSMYEQAEIIRGEVRVIDPSFSGYEE